MRDRIVAETTAYPAVEVCGLLLGHGDLVSAAPPCRNVAVDPARSFEIDPAALIAAHRAARSGGPAILGCWHSHPSGVALPSRTDAAAALELGWWWLIVGSGAIACFRAVAGGPIHDRFAAAPLLVQS